MAITTKPGTQKKKNMTLSERLAAQANSGVGDAMSFIGEISSNPSHIETVADGTTPEQKTESEVKVGQSMKSENPLETALHIETVVSTASRDALAKTAEKIDGRTTKRTSGKFVDKFTFSFPEQEKLEFKAYAARHGISITDLIMFSLDYLKKDEEDGKISLSRYGVKRLG